MYCVSAIAMKNKTIIFLLNLVLNTAYYVCRKIDMEHNIVHCSSSS